MKFRPNADMMASVLAHLLLLGLIFLYSEVHQFDPVAADTVPVEVVTQQEAAEVKAEPDPAPSPSPTSEFQLPSPDKPTDQATPQPAAQPAAPQPAQKQATQSQQKEATPPAPQPQQKQATPSAPKPSPTPQQAANAEPPPAPQPSQPAAQQPTPPSPPAYTPPEPDVSVKYGVILGLPPALPAAPAGNEPGKDNFDAAATEKADVGTGVVAEFRRHLKTCMKLPADLNAGDDVRVKLRVLMTPDGKLASAPLLIEATASAKGPLLMKSAMTALQACQPYGMLPRERYGEWKVLDLDFTPRDFGS